MAWLPTFFVILLTATALTATESPPATPALRRLCMAGILLLGLLALVSSVMGERKTTQLIADARRAASVPAATSANRTEANTAELAEQVRILKNRVRELEANAGSRLISAAASTKLSEYLRQFGAHPVIVSCIPDDAEAYNYANQIVNIFRAASWDARGPEMTKIFGDIRAMGINIYSGDNNNSEVVKILLDGFTKFNIPYHIRVAPSGSVPDSETVELFIGARPSESTRAASD
jgi:hypothetical protein